MAQQRKAGASARRKNGAPRKGDGGTPPAEAIQAAAFALFARQGFPVTTVRDVMRACGLTQGALYNHFSSKDELLSTIIKVSQGELERQLHEAVAKAGDDPADQLVAFMRAFTLRHCRRRVEALVASREFGWLDAARQADIRASRRRIRDGLVAILKRGQKAGAFAIPEVEGRSDPTMVAMAMVNMAVYVSQWFSPDGPVSEDQVADLHATLALRMVRPG